MATSKATWIIIVGERWLLDGREMMQLRKALNPNCTCSAWDAMSERIRAAAREVEREMSTH